MRNIEFNDLYKADSIRKNISIKFDNTTITNSELYNDSVSLVQSICSQDNLRFGGCEASYIKFRIPNNYSQLKGNMLTVSQIINQKTINLGKFIVDSDTPASNKRYRDIIAYDMLYTIRNTDMTKWYNNTVFPITVKNLRDTFFQYFKITQKTQTLPNDSAIVYRVESDNVGGGDILKDICLINGAFGRIDENGIFEYIYLINDKSKAIDIDKSLVKDLSYEDFQTHDITRIKLSQSNSDIDFYYGKGDNTYPLQLNILDFGTKEDSLTNICKKVLPYIADTVFTPITLTARGNMCLETGDFISTKDYKGNTIYSYILKRTFSINSVEGLTDIYEAQGTQFYTREQSTNSDAIYSTNQKISSITKNSFYSYTYTNNNLYNIKDVAKEVIQINISATNYTDAIFIASIPLYLDNDGYIVVKYYRNKAFIEGDTCRTYFSKGYNILTLCNYIPVQEDENLLLSVSLNTEYVESFKRVTESKIISLEKYAKSGGTYKDTDIDTSIPNIKILAQTIKAICFTKGLTGTGRWDGTFILEEEIGSILAQGVAVGVSAFNDVLTTSTQLPNTHINNIQISAIASVGVNIDFNKDKIVDTIDIPTVVAQWILDKSSADKLKFSTKFVTVTDKYILNKTYTEVAESDTIDKGYLKTIAINYDEFESVESVVIE